MVYRRNYPYLIQIIYKLIIVLLFTQFNVAYAIVIGPNTIISGNITYSDTTLDLTNGNFIVTQNASLTIKNSSIIGKFSDTNSSLIYVDTGTLILKNNIVSIDGSPIPPHPDDQSTKFFINLKQANAKITDNVFTINTLYRAGCLITDSLSDLQTIAIGNNTFKNFHGVIYLFNANHFNINNNRFETNTFGNLFISQSVNGTISNNSILYSGVVADGDGIDVVTSSNILIAKNVLIGMNCYGIVLISSDKIKMFQNNIASGITYAIYLANGHILKKNYVNELIQRYHLKTHQANTYITIDGNSFSQNRYGIIAINANNLQVTNNYFSQKFMDSSSRKFWTDNNILMQNVTNLTWTNNIYREAFTQENDGDNTLSEIILPYPKTGGVIL